MGKGKKTQKEITDEKLYGNLPFGEREAKRAMATFMKYVEGKQSIDAKATSNQRWWRLRHWDDISKETNEGKKTDPEREVGSAWLVNSLLNKHADIMDSFPKPNVLPREEDDQDEAKTLSSIIPVILEHNDYEQVYRMMGYDICVDGAAITGVFWDSSKNDGMGDITISNIDVHNLFWEPGITDIQDSKAVFHATLMNVEDLKLMYPEHAERIAPDNPGNIKKYDHDDNIDTTSMVEVIDCYYKRTIMKPIMVGELNTETGETTEVEIGKSPMTVVHFAKICGSEVLFCSENVPGYEEGFYEHGQYPFVVRRLFPVKDSIWGFGYLDIMKNPQKDIDKLDQAIIKNAINKANNRYWVKKNAAIDKKAFADKNVEIVEVGTGNINDQVGLMITGDMPTTAQGHLERKIDELKETSGNRDFSQGSTSAGVTAASAIAALQEAGSKLSRDINKELYRGSREEYYLIIELMRQFYTEPREFRITDGMGRQRFIPYSNQNIVAQDIQTDYGTRHRKPIFDIEITAEKQSPFSRAAQNETAKELYQMGMFNPQMAEQAMVCLSMMDFEGKDDIIQKIQQNSIFLQQFNAAMSIIATFAQAVPQIGEAAMQAGLIQPEQAPMPSGEKLSGTPEERAAGTATDNSQASKMRKKVADSSNPNK